jgi:hypothetical protein
MSIEKLIPSFIRKEPELETFEIPPLPVATLPEPPDYSQADHERDVFTKAAVQFDAIKRRIAGAEDRENALKAEVAEAVLARVGDQKKIAFLEAENAQLRNDIQTLQVDINEKNRFMSLTRQVLDKFDIKPPEKKPRLSKKAKEQANEQ